MNLDRLLEIVTWVSWILFGLFVFVSFIRSVRAYGPVVATTRLLSARLLVPLILAITLSLINASLVFIEPQYIGVVVSLTSPRGIRDQPLSPGLHWLIPLAEELTTYPIYWQTYTMAKRPVEGNQRGDDSVTARTSDGQEVTFDTSIIFRLDADQIVRIHIDWQDRYIEDFVRPTVRGIIRTQVSGFTVEEVNSSKRQDLEAQLERTLSAEFADKGLELDQFVLRNIAFSSEYAASVEQKQVALERSTQRQYEAEQIRQLAQGRADEIRRIAEAEAEAIRIRASAEADAHLTKARAEASALLLLAASLDGNPDLLIYRYIDKLSPGIRVVVAPSEAPLVLPLSGDLLGTTEETIPNSNLLPSPPSPVITGTVPALDITPVPTLSPEEIGAAVIGAGQP